MTRVHALSISVLLFIAASGCNRGKEDTPKPKSNGPIEERAGLWYATGTSNLYTGTQKGQKNISPHSGEAGDGAASAGSVEPGF